MKPEQGELFPARARASDPDTSHQAAESMEQPATARLEGVVLKVAATFGPRGCIADEILAHPMLKNLRYGTITPRLAPLIRKGLVIDTGERRKGQSGRSQRVLRAL